MKVAKLYIILAIVIGVLQVIDGLILILSGGVPVTFNYIEAMFELIWLPLSVTAIFVFRRVRLNPLSPYSYVVYNLVGWIISIWVAPPGIADTTIPIGYAIAGTLFGIYYIIINDRLYRKISGKKSPE